MFAIRLIVLETSSKVIPKDFFTYRWRPSPKDKSRQIYVWLTRTDDFYSGILSHRILLFEHKEYVDTSCRVELTQRVDLHPTERTRTERRERVLIVRRSLQEKTDTVFVSWVNLCTFKRTSDPSLDLVTKKWKEITRFCLM